MVKSLRKLIMTRSRLKNRFNEMTHEIDWSEYKKQKKFLCESVAEDKKRVLKQLERFKEL